MVHEWWDLPVRVMIDAVVYDVDRPDTAAELMRSQWPEHRGPAFARAKEVMRAALVEPESHSAREMARKAFEAAAREADILLE